MLAAWLLIAAGLACWLAVTVLDVPCHVLCCCVSACLPGCVQGNMFQSPMTREERPLNLEPAHDVKEKARTFRIERCDALVAFIAEAAPVNAHMAMEVGACPHTRMLRASLSPLSPSLSCWGRTRLQTPLLAVLLLPGGQRRQAGPGKRKRKRRRKQAGRRAGRLVRSGARADE